MLGQESFVDYRKNELFDSLLNQFSQQGLTEGLGGTDSQFYKYQDDPVGFGREVLGDTYTPDIVTLMESVRDHQITIAQSCTAVGKTHGAARIAVWWFKCFPDSQVYTAAAPPEDNLKRLLWGEIGSILASKQSLFDNNDQKSLNIERNSLSFLTGVTIPTSGTEAVREAKFSGKHAPYLLFILDECDAIPDEVFKGIEGCMSGGRARLLGMFNPRGEIGAAYRLIRDKRASIVQLKAFRHPNVMTGKDEIPGAVTRETTVRRINQWTRPLTKNEKPGDDCFELPDFLVGVVAKDFNSVPFPPLKPGWYRIIEPAFAYMVLGKYPPQGSNQLIAKTWISAARDRWDAYVEEHGEAPPSTKAIVGQDVAEMGDDENALCFRYNDYVERIQTWRGMDVLQSADHTAALCNTRRVRYVSVCAIGVGAGVSPQLNRKGVPGVPCKVSEKATQDSEIGIFDRLRDQLWWMTREWLRTEDAMLPPDEELEEELAVATYEIKLGRICVMKKDVMKELLKRSPNKADALNLTFFDHKQAFDPVDLNAGLM